MKVIVTGATGMVGEGVMYECLKHPEVEQVLVINRRPCGYSHPKLKEIIHENFFDFSPIENELSGYDACFFCLGVSSVGMKEEKYRHLTYDLTMHVAGVLAKHNPAMTFTYVSGTGTDTSEQGKLMWARVKGKTENDLMKLPFKGAFMFRPGVIKPTRGLKYTHKAYNYFMWLFPILKLFSAHAYCSLEQIGLAMIRTVTHPPMKKILEVSDIIDLSKK